ncbi:energy transducer TonB family protein [Tateyamaria sp. SN6-1]|uniref:energy transducer TonB family protein n=1 Tax=Tateyamaria sp. SN6-1 TaxID=3092148 RepID=UPI0039F4F35A
MIVASRTIAAMCMACAVGLHLGLIAVGMQPPTAQVEGQAGASSVGLGNAFQDLVQGTVSTQPVQELLDPVAPGMSGDQHTTAETPVTQTARAKAPLAPTVAPTQITIPQGAVPTVHSVVNSTLNPVLPQQEPKVASARTFISQAPSLQATTVDPIATDAHSPTDVLTATDQTDPAPIVSRRPALRSKSFEAEHAPRAVIAKTPARTPPRATPKGNTRKQAASAGSATGTTTATATQQGKSGAATDAGNAAASNYPGKVMRRLSRVSRPKVGSRGTAVVSFRVSGAGTIASVSIARSSGSAQLDRAALRVVQRAAPFPAPPAGAQRSFRINIQGG